MRNNEYEEYFVCVCVFFKKFSLNMLLLAIESKYSENLKNIYR